MRSILLLITILSIMSIPVVAQQTKDNRWNFDSLDGWVYAHQDDNPNNQTGIEDCKLRIYTRAGSVDRKKVRTLDKIYTTGRYTWRVYISDMGIGDQASIGAWIYHDDEHEIDFEIGYGKKEVRDQLKAQSDDLVAYMTTQANPFQSTPVLLKKGWHTFEIDLSLVEGKYLVQWIINNVVVSSVQQTYGTEYPFFIYCSVENLKFIGDHISSKENYALYDYVKYVFHD